METFILIFIALLVFHFLYEAIILPSIHNVLRYKILALRDGLMNVVIDDKKQISPRDFNYLMHHLEICYYHIDRITISLIVKTHWFFKKNPTYVKDNNIMTDDDVRFKNVNDYQDQAYKYMFVGFLANSAMLFLYLFPIILLAVLLIVACGYGNRAFQYLVRKLSAGADQVFDNKPIKETGYCYHHAAA